MEEVDGLIIRAITNLGCELEDVTSLKELSTEQTTEGIVRCLWQILPNCSVQSFKLPPNMTAKFRMGTAIANCVKEAGYRGDVGYQTLLYGSEVEIRRILVFLIEKLPKEAAVSSDRELSAIDLTKLKGARRLQESLDAPWTPWFCRRLKYRWDGRFWRPPEGTETVRFHSVPAPFLKDGSLSPSLLWKDLPASIIEKTASYYGDVYTHDFPVQSCESMKQRIEEIETEKRQTRPELPPKPQLLPKPRLVRASPSSEPAQEKSSEPSETEKLEMAEIASVRASIVSLHSDLDSIIGQMNQQRQTAVRIQKETEKLGRIEERSAELSDIKKMANLLDNPGESIAKLEGFLEKSDARLAKLESQYAQYSLPKQQELMELRQGRRDQSEQFVLETREMRRKAEEQTSEIETKTAFLLQLQREMDKMSKGLNRSAYTRRILEIVANVRKQREEIDRTLEDTRAVQKEINMMTGKLDRTFTATDELLFRDAKSDETVRKAYKFVVSLHEKCGELVKTSEETGQVCREIQDLQDSIETESQKATDANLERLVNDYCEVKQENDNISERLNFLQASAQ